MPMFTGLQTQNSGPFAYFKSLPGEGSVIDRGTQYLKSQIRAGASGEAAHDLVKLAGYDCRKKTRDDWIRTRTGADRMEYQEEKFGQAISYSVWCHYTFGMGRDSWWVRFEVGKSGKVLRSRVDIVPGTEV